MKLTRSVIILCLLAVFCIIFVNNHPQKQPSVVKQKENDTIVKKEVPKEKLIIVPIDIVQYTPKPKPEPVKKKEVSEPPEQKKAKPAPAKSSKGSSGNSGDNDPAILASYGMPITSYLQFMTGQGAKMAMYNTTKGKFVCAITSAGTLGNSVNHSGLSPRARRITNDFPNAQALINEARRRFGNASYEILLLMTESMDDRLHRNIKRVIEEVGRNTGNVSMVRVTYTGSSDSVTVLVDRLNGSGGSVQTSKSFYL